MARTKNALREHWVAEWHKEDTQAPDKSKYKRLAKYVSTIDDDTDEETDDTAFYDGDGTKETSVIGVKESWKFEGFRDKDDEAQNLIAGKKRKTGDDRKLWHKIVEADKKTQVEGVATATNIVTAGGDAGDYGKFECTLSFNELPKEVPYVE